MRALPQQHCRQTTDHPAHSYTNRDTWRPTADALTHRCPGRHTPSKYRAPATVPVIPVDPFAGIAGAADDSEVW